MMTVTITQSDLSRFATVGEGKVARRLIGEALAAGYTIDVNDGEETTVKRSTKAREIEAALCSTGMDFIVCRDAEGARVGSMMLVYGNAESGEELISDYSDNAAMNELYARVQRGS